MSMDHLPIAIVGAGPVGLAAAAHLLERGLAPMVFEAGATAGASIGRWGHVRMFSPWSFNIDAKAAALLAPTGWVAPPADAYPTGRDLLTQYLWPLAEVGPIRQRLHLNSRVVSVSRAGHDVMRTAQRGQAPFLLRVAGPEGERDVLARAVIDASGTYATPNWMGTHGIPALGEMASADRIAYGVPDVLGAARPRYANRRVLVLGSGHSAFNELHDLAELAVAEPRTQVLWAIRGVSLERILGGGKNDQLQERGKLGLVIGRLLDEGKIALHTGVHVDRIAESPEGLRLHAVSQVLPPVDEVIVATGFRPDLGLLSELRLELDPATQSPVRLAPLIDPNVHSCGTVRPHGAAELSHPEDGLYVVGMKSYGRAPTFLMWTGYEQVRSVTAALAGDWEAAGRVELVLPETGVCHTQFRRPDAVAERGPGCGTTACASGRQG